MSPWLYVGAGVVGLLLIAGNVALYYRGEAAIADKHTAEEKMAVAEKAAEQSKLALARREGQEQGAAQVAAAVTSQLAEQRAAFASNQRSISNASLTSANNNVVPGVVADSYDWLFERRQTVGSRTGERGATAP